MLLLSCRFSQRLDHKKKEGRYLISNAFLFIDIKSLRMEIVFVYYLFKLNLPSQILDLYVPNDKKTLFIDIIPERLAYIFKQNDEYKISDKIKLLSFELNNNVTLDIEREFNKIKEETDKFKEQYDLIVDNFTTTKSIIYSEEFLKFNETLLSKTKNIIGKNKEFFVNYESTEVDISDLNNKICTGKTVIERVRKIEKFIEKSKNIDNQIIYYDAEKEFLIISADDFDEASQISKQMEQTINGVKDEIIKNVTINPIYDNIKIKEGTDKLSFIITYPNGNIPKDIFGNIMTHINADNMGIEAEGQNLKDKIIEEELNHSGIKGYIKKVQGVYKEVAKLVQLDDYASIVSKYNI